MPWYVSLTFDCLYFFFWINLIVCSWTEKKAKGKREKSLRLIIEITGLCKKGVYSFVLQFSFSKNKKEDGNGKMGTGSL